MNESGFQNPYLCYLLFYSFSRYVPPLPISIFISIKEFSTLLVLPSPITRRLSPGKKTTRFLPSSFFYGSRCYLPDQAITSLCCSSHQQWLLFPVPHISSMASLSLAAGPTHGEGSPHTREVLPAPLMI